MRTEALVAQHCVNGLYQAGISTPPARLRVGLRTEGSEALLSVSDAGPGISVTEMPYLFERFFRGSAARAGTAPGIGLGLGLALSQALVQAHGGRIDAANLPEGGAVFTVRLRV